MNDLTERARRVVESPIFEWGIVTVILINAAVIGMGTSAMLTERYGDLFNIVNWGALGIFIIEMLIKMLAKPTMTGYFKDGWNIFDFTIIVAALVPATGNFVLIARMGRLLRVLHLVSAISQLRVVVDALVRSIPSVLHVITLISIIVYIYAILGYEIFGESDPENWGSLGTALLTLFNIITLEGWIEIADAAYEDHPMAWIYFVSFITLASFVVINLFIAIIVNNLEQEEKEQRKEEEADSLAKHEEIMRELKETRSALAQLQKRIDDNDDNNNPDHNKNNKPKP